MKGRFDKVFVIVGALIILGGLVAGAVVLVEDADHMQALYDMEQNRPKLPEGKIGWNDERVSWWPLKEGQEYAKKTGKHVMFLQYATWCPRCVDAAEFFKDEEVVRLSKHFVMVRMDTESTKSPYALDGDYIPSISFLSPDGTLKSGVVGPHPKYKYFYSDAGDLIGAMNQAKGLK